MQDQAPGPSTTQFPPLLSSPIPDRSGRQQEEEREGRKHGDELPRVRIN